jgi:hypothetical protein
MIFVRWSDHSPSQLIPGIQYLKKYCFQFKNIWTFLFSSVVILDQTGVQGSTVLHLSQKFESEIPNFCSICTPDFQNCTSDFQDSSSHSKSMIKTQFCKRSLMKTIPSYHNMEVSCFQYDRNYKSVYIEKELFIVIKLNRSTHIFPVAGMSFPLTPQPSRILCLCNVFPS